MSSTFGGLNTAASGLYAAQRGLDVTGQNVSNVNTDGYSRQRVDLRSVGASPVPAIWSTSDGIGGGVDFDDVSRITDQFLTARAQVEHGKNSQLTAEDDALTQIQQAFNEPTSGSGISTQLTDMWNAWQTLANNPTTAAGTALLSTTQTLVDGLNATRAALGTQWTDTRSNLQSVVDDANSTASDIAKLNDAIQRATQSGQQANELLDQRDQLVLKLADSMGATSQSAANGMVNVVIGGISLVSGTTSASLALAGGTDFGTPVANTPGASPAYFLPSPQIVTSTGGGTVTAGGTAGGYLNALTKLVPDYAGQLDAFASHLAGQLNGALQAPGTYDGNTPPATGSAVKQMFVSSDPTKPITAATITLNITDPKDIATSKVAPVNGTTSVDGSNADAIAQLGTAPGSPDSAYRAMIVKLGVQASSTSNNLQIQSTVTSTVDNNRESVSGVDIDEEMTNMLSFQHAYSAAAQLISTINKNLDALMSMVGN